MKKSYKGEGGMGIHGCHHGNTVHLKNTHIQQYIFTRQIGSNIVKSHAQKLHLSMRLAQTCFTHVFAQFAIEHWWVLLSLAPVLIRQQLATITSSIIASSSYYKNTNTSSIINKLNKNHNIKMLINQTEYQNTQRYYCKQIA